MRKQRLIIELYALMILSGCALNSGHANPVGDWTASGTMEMAHSATDPNDKLVVPVRDTGQKLLSIHRDGTYQFADSVGTWTSNKDHSTA